MRGELRVVHDVGEFGVAGDEVAGVAPGVGGVRGADGHDVIKGVGFGVGEGEGAEGGVEWRGRGRWRGVLLCCRHGLLFCGG